MLTLSTIVVCLIAQCTSIAVYKCNDNTSSCGCSRKPDIILKISGGESALWNNWDWVVSFRISNRHFCGGSILNEWYIITAAHCLENPQYTTSKTTVCAGTFRLSEPCHQSRTMDSIIFHPLYDNTTYENDIALVRLTTQLDFSYFSLTPICLPNVNNPNDYPEVGTSAVSIGWGSLATNTTPDELQEVSLKIMDKSSAYCEFLYNDQLQLCAGDSAKGMLFSRIHPAYYHCKSY